MNQLLENVMLTLSPARRNTRPTRESAFEWIWRGPATGRAEFGAITDAARRYIAAPPCLRDYFGRFPHCDPTDAVLTGQRGALSQHVIFGLARVLGFANYLEVGTRYGYSIGAVMAASRALQRAVTIDPFVDPEHIHANLATLDRPDVDVEMVTKMSDQFDTDERFDAIYVDGDHTYDVALSDLRQYWRYVKPGGLLLVDDTVNNRKDAIATRELIGVYWAVKDFLADAERVAAAVIKLPTYSGFAIIQKEG
jgi:predicted O-methyltransferase YrrM